MKMSLIITPNLHLHMRKSAQTNMNYVNLHIDNLHMYLGANKRPLICWVWRMMPVHNHALEIEAPDKHVDG